MAIIPQSDEELARQRLQTEGRPIADAARRNQAILAMAPSGALTSGARATAGGQLSQQAAQSMSDVSNKIGSDIFATRQAEAEQARQRGWQTGERVGGEQWRSGEAERDRAIAEQKAKQALAMGGWNVGEGGIPTFSGQIADPKTGELISAQDYQIKYGAVTEADVARTNEYQNTLQQRGFSEMNPAVQAEQTAKTKQFYRDNPKVFLEQNLSKAWGGYMMNERPNEELIANALKSNDWAAIDNEIFRAMRTRYGRGDTLSRYKNVVNALKSAWGADGSEQQAPSQDQQPQTNIFGQPTNNLGIGGVRIG